MVQPEELQLRPPWGPCTPGLARFLNEQKNKNNKKPRDIKMDVNNSEQIDGELKYNITLFQIIFFCEIFKRLISFFSIVY